MRRLYRRIENVFALEPSKLQRLVSIVEASFDGSDYKLQFTVHLRSGKKVDLGSLEEVTQQDNVVANSISEVQIASKSENPERVCAVDFDSNVAGGPWISIEVRADDLKWASDLFAAVEEQVERTLLGGLVYRVKQSFALQFWLPIAFVLALAFGATFFVRDLNKQPRLPQSTVTALTEQANSAKTTEDKLDVLFRYVVAQLREYETLPASGIPGIFQKVTPLALLAASPFVLVIGLVAYIVARCYPGSTFVWGDAAELYTSTLRRRSQLWNVVLVALVLGLLINLSSAAISTGWRP